MEYNATDTGTPQEPTGKQGLFGPRGSDLAGLIRGCPGCYPARSRPSEVRRCPSPFPQEAERLEEALATWTPRVLVFGLPDVGIFREAKRDETGH